MWPCGTGSHGRAGGHSQGPCSSPDPDSDPDLAISPVGPSLVFPSSLRFSEGSPAQLWSRYPAQARLYHLGPFLGIWAPPWVWRTLPGHWGSPWVWETLPGHWGSSLEETQGLCCGRPPASKGRSCRRLEHHQGRGPAQGPSPSVPAHAVQAQSIVHGSPSLSARLPESKSLPGRYGQAGPAGAQGRLLGGGGG